MSEPSTSAKTVSVRTMKAEDLDAVLAIDEKVSGENRSPTYQHMVDSYLVGDLAVSCIAELDQKVVGFVLGEIRDWHWGASCGGWIEVIGVDPDCQHRGIGRQLIEAFVDRCRERDVKTVHMMVEWNDSDIQSFLNTAGFMRSELASYERRVDNAGW